MLKYIKHGLNLVKHSFRDLTVGAKRSSHWSTVEKKFLDTHSTCAACGGSIRLNVHHKKPFHLFPELELEPSNLITLCMGKKECHLHLGHGGNFKDYCEDVEKLAVEALVHPEKFDDLVKLAFSTRKSS